MKDDKGPLYWLSKLVRKDGDKNGKKPQMYVYVLIVILFGAGIMMISNLMSQRQSGDSASTAVFSNQSEKTDVAAFGRKDDSGSKTTKNYEKNLQNELKDALESIAGVEDVKVIVYADSSERKVFERNKTTQKQVTDETDKEGGKRTVEDTSVDDQLVIIKGGEKEGPIVSETQKPKISGVLVVAKGAENMQVKKWIIEAVTRSLDVPSYRVSVMPKK
ncbi:stage III sporulation protein AG [Bacillus sp. OV322]|uniref:stage III sporulation protein AG n=1 Tax=Bacillus sp. OV322 TaxID=1882764 RepID=UPI0008E1965A|nr:stage III sporulation protein AG [Bacillus sp. OV322]SFC41610.1 stage III sporulation protein AG [Bacillus sp. OV322]